MSARATPRRQRGITLIVALILLVIMSMLAAATLRSTLMQERMSANAYDRDLAFQSAEAGLRLGERQAEIWAKTVAPTANTDCPTTKSSDGRYVSLKPDCPALWESETFWHTLTSTDDKYDKDSGTLGFDKKALSLAPQYIVELISVTAPCNPATPAEDRSCKRFRVTARSDASDDRASVMLQTIYATE
ncbi:MAG: pilus assembly protein [Azoarcus sp.]|jgi:type IV pilus assembly protein PilX|nr:pilus assembly protein [Azoarcus sp.]